MTRAKQGSFVVLLVFLFSSQGAFPQIDRKMKRSVATMVFSSLGGAVLGLSTLPFHGKPEEHANNITIGAILGFAAGASYVVYDSSRPQAPALGYSSSIPSLAKASPLMLSLVVDF